MPLSSDPEKRARQEAALRKGNPRAFTKPKPIQDDPGSPVQSDPGFIQADTGSNQSDPGKPRVVRARSTPAKPPARKPRTKQDAQPPAPTKGKSSFWDGFFG